MFSTTGLKREKWHSRLREVKECRREIQASLGQCKNEVKIQRQKSEKQENKKVDIPTTLGSSSDIPVGKIGEDNINELLKTLKKSGELDKKKKILKRYCRLKTSLNKWSTEDIPNSSQNENAHPSMLNKRERSDSILSFPETSCSISQMSYSCHGDLKVTSKQNLHGSQFLIDNFDAKSLLLKTKGRQTPNSSQRRSIRMTNLSKYKTNTRPHTPSLRKT